MFLGTPHASPWCMEQRDERASFDLSDGLMATALTVHHRGLDRTLETIIAKFECEDATATRAGWDTFDRELRRHFEIEEQDLLPLFARTYPVAAADLRKEHEQIRFELFEFGLALDLHQLRLEAVRDLATRLRAHAAREDSVLYPWLEKHLAPDAWRALGADLSLLAAAGGQRSS